MKNEAYENLRHIGKVIAGEPADLVRRASVYREMYAESGGRNVFPLIAAHGSLWAVGFFKKGELGAQLLSLPYLLIPGSRRAKLLSVATFAERFKDINRRICAEAYAIYHYTKYYGADRFIRAELGDEFADILCACHDSVRANTAFPKIMRERLFCAFLKWEQERIVAPALAATFAELRWGVIVHLALKLKVDMLYLGRKFPLRFENFASIEERIARGLQAYRRAEEVGLPAVAASLHSYGLLPALPVRATAEAHRPPRPAVDYAPNRLAGLRK